MPNSIIDLLCFTLETMKDVILYLPSSEENSGICATQLSERLLTLYSGIRYP